MSDDFTSDKEAMVPAYTLPDPLISQDGTPITDASSWMIQRRPEILALFEHHVYGKAPGRPKGMTFDVADLADSGEYGPITRRDATVRFTNNDDVPPMLIRIALPKTRKAPVPIFLGLNYNPPIERVLARGYGLAISNNSGCGGAALSRRRFGERVRDINTNWPRWLCTNFKQYNDNENALPVDQHELLALIAPRPVYIASAAADFWADPRGEFLAAKAADPVYRLLGTEGLPVDEMPEIHTPIHGQIGYHIREGEHDLTDYDWNQYLDFADKHLLTT